MAAEESTKKILICDDDDTLVGLLETLLEMAGYTVVTAGDGVQALEMFESEGPDLLIIDIDMPHKNGFEVLEELSIRGALGSKPLLVLSGRERKEDLARAEQFGAKGFIIKPFNGEDLVDKVRSVFSN